MPPPTASSPPLRVRTVFESWWPLATSWLLMGLELPAVSAVMARLPDPTVSLAAYGGVIFPLAMLIESPIIMLLVASTALCRDWGSYRLVRRFMLALSGSLTALHALVAFTPLFDLVAGRILAVPADILEPARTGLQIMTPWTLSIAYRRTQQGVLIRFGHARAVGIGTAVRLAANLLVLGAGLALGTVPGIVVGTLAVACGVMSEAVYAGLRVHSVLRDQVRPAPPPATPLTATAFMRFYVPLMMTPFIMLLSLPLTSAAMSRMPRTLDSLAVWPVINGLVFTLRSVGFALNEVVVSLLERPRALAALRRFTFVLAACVSLPLVLVAATPLGRFWFGGVSALPSDLAGFANTGLWICWLLPGISALQSLYQGTVVHSHRTRGVTESVIVYLATSATLLLAGIATGLWPGLFVALAALAVGGAAQLAWLVVRARGAMREIAARDASQDPTPAETLVAKPRP